MHQNFQNEFEIIIVEDGSTIPSKEIVDSFSDRLNINYVLKANSGPGMARNVGMQEATAAYFIILDSDCILPPQYLKEVDVALQKNFTDVFGGPDASHSSFSTIQKSINYAMTSFLTTGGIRGNKQAKDRFQPRSFNMGISRVAFETTNGFSKQRFGEDIEFVFRLWDHGFESQFIAKAFVYHKRRTNWQSFLKQTFNFGAARPILNTMHKDTAKITYWFPSVFCIGLAVSVVFSIFRRYELLYLYVFYFACIFIHSLILNKSVVVAANSILATIIQFLGYGIGFLRSFFRVSILQKPIKQAFPRMFS